MIWSQSSGLASCSFSTGRCSSPSSSRLRVHASNRLIRTEVILNAVIALIAPDLGNDSADPPALRPRFSRAANHPCSYDGAAVHMADAQGGTLHAATRRRRRHPPGRSSWPSRAPAWLIARPTAPASRAEPCGRSVVIAFEHPVASACSLIVRVHARPDCNPRCRLVSPEPVARESCRAPTGSPANRAISARVACSATSGVRASWPNRSHTLTLSLRMYPDAWRNWSSRAPTWNALPAAWRSPKVPSGAATTCCSATSPTIASAAGGNCPKDRS